MRIKKTQYFLAVRERKNHDRFFEDQKYQFTELEIECGDRWWLADPFLFEHNGKTYVFYEAYDLYFHRGKIGYSVIDGFKASKPKIILDCPYHMSFPYIFEQNGEIYIMPETNKIDALRLFRAKEFPDKWVEDKVLITRRRICDTILLEDDSNSYLMVNKMLDVVPKGTTNGCWVQSALHKFQQNKVTFDRVVKEGDKGVRNAGKIFEYNDKQIRPGQDCTDGQYGKGMIFFEINSFEPYKEQEVYQVDYRDIQKHLITKKSNLNGVHTYNSTQNLEIIDVSYEGWISQKARILYILYRRTMVFKFLTKLRRWFVKTSLCHEQREN